MADEQYAAYSYEFGYPPKQPSHLIAFAKKNGVKVTWGQAKQLIKKAPDVSDYVPPLKNDGQIINQPLQRKNTEEKKCEKIEIAKRYSSANINIDQKQLFGVTKRNTLQKYQYLVTQLTSMGWDQNQSLEALKATNGNLQLAMEMLMTGEINNPMITLKNPNNSENQHNLRNVPKKNGFKDVQSQPQPQPQPQQVQQQPQSQPQPQVQQQSQWNNQFQNRYQNNYPQPNNNMSNMEHSQNNTHNHCQINHNNNTVNNYAPKKNPHFNYQPQQPTYNNYDNAYENIYVPQHHNANSNNTMIIHSNEPNSPNINNTPGYMSPSPISNQFEYSTVSNNYAPPTNKTKQDSLQLFLNNLALGHYYNNFINYGFGTELSGLSDLNEQILMNMGIHIMAHRRTILTQLHGPDYFKQQQPMQPIQAVQPIQQQQSQDIDLDNAFEKLLGGHGSIKQRLRSMDTIFNSLDYMNIETDNGKVLLSAFAEQILHEDYIFREYKVRIKAIETISKIFIFCVNKVSFNEIPNLCENSLCEIFDNLFLLLDNNRCKKFHDLCKQCINKIIESIVNIDNKQSIITVCGLLNEKVNIENINQPHARFYASNLIFENIIFKYNVQLINNMFNFDINRYDNKLIKYTNGIPQNLLIDTPKNNLYFNLLIATNWQSNDEETFKDIITDCLSMMILDPNCDIGIVGNNLTVYFNSFNINFRNSLETEAKYRFKKYYTPITMDKQTPMQPLAQSQPLYNGHPLKQMNKVPNQPIQKHENINTRQQNGEVDYRIKQLTAVSVAPPTLPSI